MKKHFVWMSALVLGACLFFTGTAKTKAAEEEETKIEEGVCIGTVNVGGMTESEAYDAISDYVDSLMSTTFTLEGVDDKSIEVTAEDMGVSCDPTDSVNEAMAIAHKGNLIDRYKASEDLKTENTVLPLVLEVDKQKTANLIYKRHNRLSRLAVNASLKKKDGEFTFVAGTDGLEVDEVNSVYEINRFLQYDFTGDNTQIALATVVTESKGTEEELAQVTDVLGSFNTDYSSSSEGRKTNVARAVELINGSILYPGEEISVHDTISPINEDNGYAIGHAYVSGQVVESVGGGVCQVATTLYNAVIRAELEITERYNHSMLVSYVDPSDDAALAGDYKDLKFKNNTEYPVYIEGYVSGGSLYFNVYGHETRDANRKVTFESEVLEQDEAEVEFKLSSDLDAGTYNIAQPAHLRTVAQLWKVVTVDGKEESRELFNKSTYKAGTKEYEIGTKGATAEMLSVLKTAIKTGDEDTVKAAVKQVKGMIADQKKKTTDTGGDTTDSTDTTGTDTTGQTTQ